MSLSTDGVMDFDESSQVSIISNASAMSIASSSSIVSTQEMNKNTDLPVASNSAIEEQSLEDLCRERPYLDGHWYVPDLKNSTVKKVFGICQICKIDHNKDKFISGALTVMSNFRSHIKAVHNKRLADFDDYCAAKKRRLELEGSERKKELQTQCSFSQKRYEANVAHFVLDTFVPYNIVETSSFRKIFDDMKIRQAGKTLQHLSTRTLVRRVDDAFTKHVADRKKSLLQADYVCTTADVWSSKHRRFMGVTAHVIDEKTLMTKSYAIACKRFPGSHTHDKIAEMLNNIHSEFGLTQEKLCGTVTDNGSNFIKAFREFGVNLEEFHFCEGLIQTDEEKEMDGFTMDSIDTINSSLLPPHQKCASHTLNLVATTDILNGLKSFDTLKLVYDDVIKKCTALWKLTRSPKQYEIILEILGKALNRPVVVRWNSLHDCFVQLVELKEKLMVLSTKLQLENSLTEQNFLFIQEYVECTTPIAQALDILQGEKDITYGYLLPTLISTRNKLIKLQKKSFTYCHGLIQILLDGLNKRFKNIFDVEKEGKFAAVAAATHPRFKLRWLKCLTADAQKRAKEAVKEALASFAAVVVTQSSTEKMDVDDDGFDFDGGDNVLIVQPTLKNDYEEEYGLFCQDTSKELCILHAYPRVKKVFIKFNTLLPSSAPAERMFNYATMFDIAKFNRLNDTNFEKRVLSKANKLY